MALADILQAIKAQADKEIALLQEQATSRKNALKMKTDDELKAYEEEMKSKTEEKKQSLTQKAHTMVQMERRKALLTEKRKALDAVYEKALKELKSLPKAKLEKIESALAAKVKGRKGEIKKHSSGGFLFVSDKAVEDYSFEHIVREMLRPETELDAASKLFA